MQCPDDCHACCKASVTMDLTAIESLVIYLLNRDMVHLIEQYTNNLEPSGYCPFMVMDKCIINTYKPSACQMYIPFDYEGGPICFYTAGGDIPMDSLGESYMNSNAYGIHGFMVLMQADVERYLPCSSFKNIYQGTLWWKNNYHCLPDTTRICLEAIVDEEYIGLKLVKDFNFDKALLAGRTRYADLIANKPDL